ncbi:hypothetical protein [uncultured Acinetobacter sp.]|uniref:hypothetical protein n=1 Tax=uncultured Acinetobacter sp. TaxID=165433 RepID=UPI0025833AF3|nr:hypothetical protein [uncultured Acinetobacter sp.]
MWSELPIEKREKYKLLIQNFASLSKVFSQKSSDSDGNNITPIVNSKFQETAFQKAFDAISEDIANTSYDASIKLDDNKKYLVGIKSFGFKAGFQKIAQFKKDSKLNDWDLVLAKIKANANGKNVEDANKLNKRLYQYLAIEISNLRNDRIASSKSLIKGFKSTSCDIQAVYHVLMPQNLKLHPQILLGEIEYLPIDIDNLEIFGASKTTHPTNFTFTDGKHKYQYTSADSQLLMHFDNKNIVLETWDVEYLENPFTIFENLHKYLDENQKILDSVSWMIPNESGEVEESSGFNSFDGTTKLQKKERYRETRIEKIKTKYSQSISGDKLDYVINVLEKILLDSWTQSTEEINRRKTIRSNLIKEVLALKNLELLKDIEKLVFRSSKEMYIPIPDSKFFHNNKPDFFGKDIGTFKKGTTKLALSPKQREFKLTFIPSGNEIQAYINQASGKAIQSSGNQDILGKWILEEVFQLPTREPLTSKRLNEIGINGIRLIKFKDSNKGIGLEFIWIDEENPPKDAIGWVAKNKKKSA